MAGRHESRQGDNDLCKSRHLDGEWKDYREDGKGTMKYHNGDVHEGHFSKGKMHGKGTYEYAAGDVLKSIGEWKEGKKCGLFEDFVRVSKQVYYDNDELVLEESNVTSEATSHEDTDSEDALPRKRCNVCVTP